MLAVLFLLVASFGVVGAFALLPQHQHQHQHLHHKTLGATRTTKLQATAGGGVKSSLLDNMDALILDCDGTIVETEQTLTLSQFNACFKAKNLKIVWTPEMYGDLLPLGDSKARFEAYLDKEMAWPLEVSPSNKKAFVQELKEEKDRQFESVFAQLKPTLLPRPGITRLVAEALANNLPLAVVSNSLTAPVKALCESLLGSAASSKIVYVCGDNAAKAALKPSPEMYLQAAKQLQVAPERCWVIEDSEVGLQAAKGANMRVVITPSFYTTRQNFDASDLLVTDLDKGMDGPVTLTYLNYKASSRAYKPITPIKNADMFATSPNLTKMFGNIVDGKMPGMPF